MRSQRIGVLMGGLSSERMGSLASGQAVLDALLRRGHQAEAIFVDRELDLGLRQAQIEVAFLALHGRYGEDGCVQGMLELLGVPYTGSGVLASAVAMNKGRAKELFRLHGLATPPAYVATIADGGADEIVARHADFGFPVVVKPLSGGSSLGVAIARTLDQLVEACERAARHEPDVLVERLVVGREISVAVLEGRALGAVEIAPAHGLYDHATRCGAAAAEYYLPPRLTPERYRSVLEQAERAHRVLGCAGATQVDLLVGPTGSASLLEVDVIPPLHETALLPRIARHAGLELDDLCEAMLGGARLHAGPSAGERRLARHHRFAGDDRRAEAPERH
jgi:D-alanine-D-alanine ligase